MARHWIGVSAGEHVAIAVAESFAMFAHGRHTAAKRVASGDWVAYYCPREGMNSGAELRAFMAIGQAVDGSPSERMMVPGVTGWHRPMQWLKAKRADVYPLLERLSFVTNRSHWGMYFRKSLFAVEAADFALIADAMGVGSEYRRLSNA
ncbi:MAG: EVE domain-containing protein [Rhizobiaceae bacterium]